MMAWKDETPLEANWCLTLQRRKIKVSFISFPVIKIVSVVSPPPQIQAVYLLNIVTNKRELWIRDVCCKCFPLKKMKSIQKLSININILLAILRCFDSVWNGHRYVYRSENITCNWNLTPSLLSTWREFYYVRYLPPYCGLSCDPPAKDMLKLAH